MYDHISLSMGGLCLVLEKYVWGAVVIPIMCDGVCKLFWACTEMLWWDCACSLLKWHYIRMTGWCIEDPRSRSVSLSFTCVACAHQSSENLMSSHDGQGNIPFTPMLVLQGSKCFIISPWPTAVADIASVHSYGWNLKNTVPWSDSWHLKFAIHHASCVIQSLAKGDRTQLQIVHICSHVSI